MAKTTSVTLRIVDPSGLADAIATLEHIRDDADHRIAALRATAMRSMEVASPLDPSGPVDPCRFRLADAWHCITHDRFWNPNSETCNVEQAHGPKRRSIGGTSGTKPPPSPPSDRG